MTRDEAFLQAIREAPDDDAPRLIYADWLEERGDPRGPFIRLRCDAARLASDDPRGLALDRKANDLLRANWEAWVVPLRDLVGPDASRQGNGWLLRPFHRRESLVNFPRGYVEDLAFDGATFLDRAEAVFGLTPLRCLRLWGAGEHTFGLAESPWLAYIQALFFADYYFDPLTPQGAVALAASPHCTRLKFLHLDRNNVGDGGAAALAGAPWATGLAFLHLGENGVSAAGVEALAASPRLSGLQTLALSGNPIGDEGVVALTTSPYLTGLQWLMLGGCDLGPQATAALAAWPHLARLKGVYLNANFRGDAAPFRAPLAGRSNVHF